MNLTLQSLPEIFIDRNIMFMYLKKQPLRGLFLNGFEFQQGNRMSLSQK